MEINEESRSQQVSEQEERERVSIRERGPGTGSISGAVQGEPIRATRIDCSGTNLTWFISINGGILTQLIRQAERQLGEAEACITWYEERKQEAEEWLRELKSLAEEQQKALEAAVEAEGSDDNP